MNEILDSRRLLPSVDRILQSLKTDLEMECFSHVEKTEAARWILNRLRAEIDSDSVPALEEIVQQTRQALAMQHLHGLHKAVNATGIILHTGLGRAALPPAAMDAVAQLDGFCNLQINLEDGTRGRRDGVIESILRTLTGAEAAAVVNNNAAATLLVLAALCAGKEVIVSRGQLIEIGGSFRLPDVIAQSGARMVEVGTTNKTHLRDYAAAIGSDTGALLRVNPSNYRIVGFSKSVTTAELAGLKADRDLVLVDDLGCGALLDLGQYGLPHEATVQESVRAGADVTMFSGDKLIGGPQSGIIVGKKKYIDLIRKHPLARALRVDKFTIAALEATLRLFLSPDTLPQTNPTIRMITRTFEELRERAHSLQNCLAPFLDCRVIEGESACGGGSLPDAVLKTAIVSAAHRELSAAELARRLRLGDPAIVTRIQDNRICIDVRTFLQGDDARVVQAVEKAVNQQ